MENDPAQLFIQELLRCNVVEAVVTADEIDNIIVTRQDLRGPGWRPEDYLVHSTQSRRGKWSSWVSFNSHLLTGSSLSG